MLRRLHLLFSQEGYAVALEEQCKVHPVLIWQLELEESLLNQFFQTVVKGAVTHSKGTTIQPFIEPDQTDLVGVSARRLGSLILLRLCG